MRIAKEYVDKRMFVAVIGFENKPEEIFRSLDPWIPHVDGVIAGDGRFTWYPADHDFSKSGWLQAAESRYKDRVEFIGYEFAGRQYDKRQMYLDLAGKAKADYLFVVDSEEFIDPKYNDFDKYYRNLLYLSEATTNQVFFTYVWIPSPKIWSKQGNQYETNVWLPIANIHKNPGKQRFCCDRHYIWSHKNTTDETLYKWQIKHGVGKDNPYEYRAKNVVDGVRKRQDRKLRARDVNSNSAIWAFLNEQDEASRQFYAIADLEGKIPPPIGFKNWHEYMLAPHTFNLQTGQRIDLDDKGNPLPPINNHPVS